LWYLQAISTRGEKVCPGGLKADPQLPKSPELPKVTIENLST